MSADHLIAEKLLATNSVAAAKIDDAIEEHVNGLPTLQRIAAVLNEELLVCFQRIVDGEVEREFAALA